MSKMMAPSWHATARAIFLCTIASNESSAQVEGVTLRAVGPELNSELVKVIALNAQPFPFSPVQREEMTGLTPRSVAVRLCGSLPGEYIQELIAVNQITTSTLDEPLGERAKSFVWPACLYIKKSPTVPIPGAVEAVTKKARQDLYTDLTGGKSSRSILKKFFKVPGLNIRIGVRTAQVSHITAPVYLVPKTQTNAEFIAEIQQAETRPATAANSVQVLDNAQGEIVIGQLASASSPTCAASPQVPFDAGQVYNAYQFSQAQAQEAVPTREAGQAEVFVVDNGFFGAVGNLEIDVRKRFELSPFNPRYFHLNNESTISQVVIFPGADLSTRKSYPLNYSNEVKPGPLSGHGTHVTGLILGGPGFNNYREIIRPNGPPWAKITVLNLSRGAGNLIAGSSSLLQSRFGGEEKPRIVNMSIAHYGDASAVKADYGKLFSDEKNLFIVAAGNTIAGADVRKKKVYPAALGGSSSHNIITVGALDGDGRRAAFSNWSTTAVDIAAPGCEIASWLSNSPETTKLSGTSQAAPLVTFAAALLRSLDANSTPFEIKSRLIASGDLVPVADRYATVFGVALNIPKALYWFDDYVKVEGTFAGTYLGDVKRVEGLRCAKGQEFDKDDVFAFKRALAGGPAQIFHGRAGLTMEVPCEADEGTPGLFVFVAHSLLTDKVHRLPQEIELKLPLSEVTELIFAASN